MGEVAVITGTTHGIGRVTSRELARAGRTVVMLCRDLDAGRAVRDEILTQLPRASVHLVHCDLASLQSVRNGAAAVRSAYGRIDLLVNNAGMVSTRHRVSVDGFELTFATNHLGPFLLTALLLDRLDETARVINVASRAHFRAHPDFDRVTNPRAPYNAMAAYAQSKLANVLHTFALARRLAGTRICVNCLHPGVVASNLLPRWLRLIKPLLSRRILDVEDGARTTLHLALAEGAGAVTGRYFDERQQAASAAQLAHDVRLQETLWRKSSLWSGVAP
ncbi:MAG TPA: SDR family oxidoreductase [Steroidobacteraceae bacterium]|nr:SDR family oxidoreductase [Steroidobacteraceae bacterium]